MSRFPLALVLGVLCVPALGAHAGDAASPQTAPPPAADAAAPPAGRPSTSPSTPVGLDAKKLKAPQSTPELLEKGKAVFAANCVACHGESGHGDGPAGIYMNPRPRDFSRDPFKQGAKPEQVFVTVTEGVKDTAMVGWPQISEEERWAVSHYVLTMVPSKGGKAKKGT